MPGLILSSCFSGDDATGRLGIRLSNSSSTKSEELDTVQVRLYGDKNILPLTETTDPVKICTFIEGKTRVDDSFHTQEFEYKTKSARLLVTVPTGKLSLILEAFHTERDRDGLKHQILAAKGVKTDVSVELGGTTEAGEIELADTLKESAPSNVTVAGRTGRIAIKLDAVVGAKDYIVCIKKDGETTLRPLVFDTPAIDIREYPPETSGTNLPIANGTKYWVKLYARNVGGLSPAAKLPEAYSLIGTGTDAAYVFPATPQNKIEKTDVPQFVQDKSGTWADLAWEAVDGATAYCVDAPVTCLEAGTSSCEVDPKLAHAYLPDTENQSLVKCEKPAYTKQRCLRLTYPSKVSECQYSIYAVNEGNGVSDAVMVTLTRR